MSVQAPGKVAYLNARLLDPATGFDGKGGLLADGELIVERGPDLFKNGVPEGAETIDCRGACLAPGLVDMRVQLREPGEEHKETLASASQAAVAGGVTSMVCLPNTDPVIDDIAAVEFVARIARKIGLAKVYPYAAATKALEGKELAEIGMLAEAGALGFTDGTKPIASAQMMRRLLTYASNFNALIIQHPEEPSMAQNGVMNDGELATRLGLSGISTAAEAIIIERDIRLFSTITGGRLHIGHISTGDGVDLIRAAKKRGLKITCDTAPPYFALNELAVGDYRTFSKLSPPLRSEDDRLAIVEGIKDGTIDAIASDHAPQDQDSKRLPFAQAEFGGVGLETLLQISLELYHNEHLTLLQMIDRLSYSPSRLLGLPSGTLAPGAPADLVIFNPDRAGRVNPDKFRSKSKNTPFDGRPVQGRVLRTVVDGRSVFIADD